MKKVCAWCNPGVTNDEKTTHGICESCHETWLEESKKTLEERQKEEITNFQN